MEKELLDVIRSGKPFWTQVFACSAIYLKYNPTMHPDVAFFNAKNFVYTPLLEVK